MGSYTTYEHQPLPRVFDANTKPIRLLNLFPGPYGNDNHIIGQLEFYNLPVRDPTDGRPGTSTAPRPGLQGHQYEALSYHWGPEDKTRKYCIYLFGGRQSSVLRITPNLNSALRQLRLEHQNRWLWVDAICINQDDPSEKSEQLPIMDQIFGRATNVCVWLGKSDESSARAFRHMKEVLNLSSFDQTVREDKADAWAALSKLMRRPWFSRRWVVQEIAFARQATVHCGEHTIDWSEMADAVTLFSSRSDDIAQLFRGDRKYNHRVDYLGDVEALGANRLVMTISKLFRRSDDGERVDSLLSLESLISNLSAFKATQPHDIIYAVLSLARDVRASAILPKSRFAEVMEQQDEVKDDTAVETEHGMNHGASVEQNGLLSGQNNQNGNIRPPESNNTSSRALGPFLEAQDVPLPSSPQLEAVSSKGPLPYPQRQAYSSAKPSVKEELRLKKKVETRLRTKIRLKTFQVDYKNKRFLEVCREFIEMTIQSSDSLDMLCRPWAPVKEELPADADKLPSWICQLDKSPFRPRPDGNYGRVNADILVGMPDSGGRTYSASANTTPKSFYVSTQSLFVDGFVLDEIGQLRIPAIEGNVPNEWLELGGWRDTSTTPPESFWRVLVAGKCCVDLLTRFTHPFIRPSAFHSLGFISSCIEANGADRDEAGHNPPPYYRRTCQYAFAQRVQGGSLNTERLMASESSKITVDFLKRVQSVIWNRRLMKTSSETRLGLVPHNAKSGDYIAILKGMSVPVVLRQLPPPVEMQTLRRFSHQDVPRSPIRRGLVASGVIGQHCQDLPLSSGQITPSQEGDQNPKPRLKLKCVLIGECYLHGFMDGEAFQVRNRRGLRDFDFEII